MDGRFIDWEVEGHEIRQNKLQNLNSIKGGNYEYNK